MDVRTGAFTLMINGNVCETTVPRLSRTETGRLPVPGVVGMPERVPSVASAKPGIVPVVDQVKGGMPPVAANLKEYGLATVALGRDVVVMTSVGATT
jgi:hypothetical protein